MRIAALSVRPGKLFLTLAVAPLIIALLVPSAANAAKSKPDLRISSFTVSAKTVAPGAKVNMRVTTKNYGKAKAKASYTRIYLGSTVKASFATKSLKKYKYTTAVKAIAAPNASGTYTYKACADAKKTVKEKSESNNCRTLTLTVVPTGLIALPKPLKVTPTFSGSPLTERFEAGSETTFDPMDVGTGVTAQVDLPDDTLVEDVPVTVTKVQSLAGHPFTAVLGAVSVTPDVLTERPFTTTFHQTTPSALSTLVAFTADADGTDLRLAPVDPFLAGADISVVLTHGGIVGLATATPAQISALAARWPTDADQQMEAAFAGPLRTGLIAQRASSGTGWQTTAVAASKLTDTKVLTPALSAAASNVATGPVASRLVVDWKTYTTTIFAGTGDPTIDARVATVTQANADLLDGVADYRVTSCYGIRGGAAVLGAVARLRLIDHTTKADQVLDDAKVGSECGYAYTTIEQSWQIDEAGTDTTIHDTGVLKGARYDSPALSPTGVNLNLDLAWDPATHRTTITTVAGCSTTVELGPSTNSRVGLRHGRLGVTSVRGGGTLPMTLIVRMYADNTDPDGVVNRPMLAGTTSTSCMGGPAVGGPLSSITPELPFDDPQATGANGGIGGEFEMTDAYLSTHTFESTVTTPVPGGQRVVSQYFTVQLHST